MAQLVRVAVAQHQPEAELMVALLRDHGIGALAVRTGGFDVPDFLASGPRDIKVAADDADRAREVLGTTGALETDSAGSSVPRGRRDPVLRVLALVVAVCVLVGALAGFLAGVL